MKRPGGHRLPRALTLLGELGECVLFFEGTKEKDEHFYGFSPRGGTLLFSTADGRSMYALRPVAAAAPPKVSTVALQALELYERFQMRGADELYNCRVPTPRKPDYRGDLVVCRYTTAKGNEPLVEWEHYFDRPGVGPAYAELWSLGRDQYWIPPGPWRVAEDGIEYASPRGRRNA